MIINGTYLNVADNSGARLVQCIKILGVKDVGGIGDLVVVVVKDAVPRKKIKKGDICKGVIIRTMHSFVRYDGSYLKFSTNEVVLVDNNLLPYGTSVKGPLLREFRNSIWSRLTSLVSYFV